VTAWRLNLPGVSALQSRHAIDDKCAFPRIGRRTRLSSEYRGDEGAIYTNRNLRTESVASGTVLPHLQIKTVCRQFHGCGVAQEAKYVEKGENAAVCQGESIKNAKQSSEIQINGC
jgi:hypothetical protein